jgi:alginate O-acetyltransferase complex protein AlgJ
VTAAKRWLFRLPVLAGAGLLAFCAFQIAWNATVGERWPLLAFHLKYPPGYVAGAGTPLTWANLLNDSYQKDAAQRLGIQSMLYRSAVRWKHQAYWSLLGMSGVSTILVGKDGELIETAYSEEYCRRDPAEMHAAALPWAERIRALQDAFNARGQMFLYVMTPSKLALHPDYLPDDFPCPGHAHANEKLAIYRDALRHAGVHFVDGPALMREELGHYALDLYPVGGIHWDMIGAALAAQAVVGALDQQGAHLAPFTFTVTPTYNGGEWDRDLAEILNLMYPVRYLLPELTYSSHAASPCQRHRIVEDAGSFIFQINDALAQIDCAPEVRPYFYWTNYTLRAASDGRLHRQPENPEQRRTDFLDWADIVILEENEASLPNSAHANKLMEMMRPNAEARG